MRNLTSILLTCFLFSFVALAQNAKGKAGRDEAAVRALEQKWEDASARADIATLETILHENLITTSAEGHVRTRAEMIKDMKSGDLKFLSSKIDDLKVAVYGDTAIVNGRWSGKVVEKGNTVESVERFTDTFVRQHGKWMCVASHSSVIH